MPDASICRLVWSCMNFEYVVKLWGGGGDTGMEMVYESCMAGIRTLDDVAMGRVETEAEWIGAENRNHTSLSYVLGGRYCESSSEVLCDSGFLVALAGC